MKEIRRARNKDINEAYIIRKKRKKERKKGRKKERKKERKIQDKKQKLKNTQNQIERQKI